MQDLLQLAEYIKNYSDALKRGVEKFSKSLPILTQQHISQEARQKLNDTREEYLAAVKSKFVGTVLLVELDRDSWIANAVETGIDGFDMKANHLRSPKARTGKNGYRYIRIPIGKKKGSPGGSTPKSQEFQQKINEVLDRPKFGMKRLKGLMDGSVVESQAVMTDEPMLKGFYRVRQFETAQAYHSGRAKPAWQFVLFRTMTNNPAARSKWQHPGIKPVHIFRSTERWLESTVEGLAASFIQAEVDALNRRMGGDV